ncbi:MAG: hypothetical protein ABI209_15060 [Edaphobacter sp.]
MSAASATKTFWPNPPSISPHGIKGITAADSVTHIIAALSSRNDYFEPFLPSRD